MLSEGSFCGLVGQEQIEVSYLVNDPFVACDKVLCDM